MIQTKTTFITAYMTIYTTPYKDLDWRFEKFKRLCQTGINLAVFCSRDVEDYFRKEILSIYKNVILIDVLDLNETWTWQTYHKVADEVGDIDLPNTRNPNKDTKEYLLLMNAKTEYMVRAIEKNVFNSTHFAWIDFNIFHIFQGIEKESLASYWLKTISQRQMPEYFLTLPGCWSKDYVNESSLLNDICWRFCGGFFLGSLKRILEFHREYTNHFSDFLREHRKLVWEVNFWAWAELKHGLSVVWYAGDHDERILLFNGEFISHSLYDTPGVEVLRYQYPDHGNYIPTSTSFVCHKGKYMINTRYVNYWLWDNGVYLIKDEVGAIRTRNFISVLDEESLMPVSSEFLEIEVDEMGGLVCHGGSIYGLEDIRLFNRMDGELGFIATSINYSGLGRNRMVTGKLSGEKWVDCRVLIPPDSGSWCEKNWIPISFQGGDSFIYKWMPFQVGSVKEGQLSIHTTWEHRTPMFSNIRGSSVFIDYVFEGVECFLGVVHFSYEGRPRRYFHCLVLLEKENLKPLKYSDFFVFHHVSIEFCIGFMIHRGAYQFWLSNFDRDPEKMSVPMENIPLKFDFYYGV